MTHIPYRGGGPAVTDVMGGQVPLLWVSIPAAAQFVKAGKLKALAVSTLKRSAAFPDVPTMQEAGVADFEVDSWYAVFVPAKTPAPRDREAQPRDQHGRARARDPARSCWRRAAKASAARRSSSARWSASSWCDGASWPRRPASRWIETSRSSTRSARESDRRPSAASPNSSRAPARPSASTKASPGAGRRGGRRRRLGHHRAGAQPRAGRAGRRRHRHRQRRGQGRARTTARPSACCATCSGAQLGRRDRRRPGARHRRDRAAGRRGRARSRRRPIPARRPPTRSSTRSRAATR